MFVDKKMGLIKFICIASKRSKVNKKRKYANYLAFQRFQAKEIIKELKKRNIDLSSMKVLELGVGKGGYSPIFNESAKELIITDINRPMILKRYPSFKFRKVDVNKKFPFQSNSFDFVFSSSLIEHIKYPENMLSEIRRVLKPNGFMYLSFPPFYSPVGGHNVKPFHLFGEKFAIKITNFLKKKRLKGMKLSSGILVYIQEQSKE